MDGARNLAGRASALSDVTKTMSRADFLDIRVCEAYCRRVRRITHFLACLLAGAQILLAIPAIAASAAPASEPHCPGMAVGADQGAHSDDCPCCPEGTSSMADCLVSCMLSAAAPVHAEFSTAAPAQDSPAPVLPLFRISAAEPPLKPPPIT
jgi:hypothetical protein